MELACGTHTVQKDIVNLEACSTQGHNAVHALETTDPRDPVADVTNMKRTILNMPTLESWLLRNQTVIHLQTWKRGWSQAYPLITFGGKATTKKKYG